MENDADLRICYIFNHCSSYLIYRGMRLLLTSLNGMMSKNHAVKGEINVTVDKISLWSYAFSINLNRYHTFTAISDIV